MQDRDVTTPPQRMTFQAFDMYKEALTSAGGASSADEVTLLGLYNVLMWHNLHEVAVPL
jgi:hypothetical protein